MILRNYYGWFMVFVFVFSSSFFFFLEDISPFCGAANTPILDFWWCLPWVSKPGWFPHLRASLPAHKGFLRFTSGVAPADCIEVSMAAKPFWSTCLQTCLRALVEGLGARIHDRPHHTHSAVNHSATPAPACISFA